MPPLIGSPPHEDLGKSVPNLGSEAVVCGSQDCSSRATSDEPRMPFIRTISSYKPWEEITVSLTLNIKEDLYLVDHMFIHAPGVKPPSACLPVLPMAFGLEIMAETAACLTPGLGLTGFEDVSASRWISLEDAESISLQISARVLDYSADSAHFRIRVEVRTDAEKAPALSGTVLLGKHYLLRIGMQFDELLNQRRSPLTGEQLYSERHLFHGPLLQCMSGEMTFDDRSIIGKLRVLPVERLFRSIRAPELLTHPVILDGVAQALAVFGSTMEMQIFPIGFRNLDIYSSTPPVDRCCPSACRSRNSGRRTCYADVEVQNGRGTVWMRMRGWGGWIFRWTKELSNFRRLPTVFTSCTSLEPPHLPPGAVCRFISKATFRDYDPRWMARCYLHSEEVNEFEALSQYPVRQLQWLLGRIAAKDAVRVWLARGEEGEMFHPAAFIIRNDEDGRPFVADIPQYPALPDISISHSGDHAVAVAHKARIGIDIERIEQRGLPFLESFSTSRERALLESIELPSRDALVTSLWCAKEAVAKCLGTGVKSAPQLLEAVQIYGDGRIAVIRKGSDRIYLVSTMQRQDYIVATANGSGH